MKKIKRIYNFCKDVDKQIFCSLDFCRDIKILGVERAQEFSNISNIINFDSTKSLTDFIDNYSN